MHEMTLDDGPWQTFGQDGLHQLESAQLLDSLLSSAPLAIAVLDCDLRYIACSAMLCELVGMDPVGHTLQEAQPYLAAVIAPLLRRVLVTGKPLRECEFSGQTRGRPGQTIHFANSYFPVRDAQGRVRGVAAIINDISARKRAEIEAEARARQQAMVTRLGVRALSVDDLCELAAEVSAALTALLEVDYVSVLSLEPDGRLRLRGGSGWGPHVVQGTMVDTPVGSQAGFTLRAREPVVVSELSLERRFRPSAFLAAHGVRSGMSVVIEGRGRPYGVLGVYVRERRDFTVDDANFLQAAANVLGAATARNDAEQALRRSERMREAIAAQMLAAADETRERIATDLHDDTVQVMTATLVGIDRISRALRDADHPRAADAAASAREMLALCVERTRRLMFHLRPATLDAHGLCHTLTDLASDAAIEAGFALELDLCVDRYPHTIETLVYRLVSEFVHNARKHAQAQHLGILIREQDGWLCGVVRDDGVGFDVAKAAGNPDSHLHMGLSATLERARLAGGEVELSSALGAGSEVRFKLPLPRAGCTSQGSSGRQPAGDP